MADIFDNQVPLDWRADLWAPKSRSVPITILSPLSAVLAPEGKDPDPVPCAQALPLWTVGGKFGDPAGD